MKRRSSIIAIVIATVFCTLGILVFWYTGTQAFMQSAGRLTSEEATRILGTRVDIHSVQVDSLRTLTVKDIVLYDRKGNLMVKAESAQVNFSLFAMLKNSPAAAVNEVVVRHPQAQLIQAENGAWNYEEIFSGKSTQNSFVGKVHVEEGTLSLQTAGKSLQLSDLSGVVDFAENPTVQFKGKCKNQGASLDFSGVIGAQQRMFSVEGKDLSVENYVSLLPTGTLPQDLQIKKGKVEKISLSAAQRENQWHLNGQVVFSDGQVVFQQTKIEGIAGLAVFSDQSVAIFAHAETAGQKASVHGRVHLDTSDPYMELVLESQGFDPGMVFKNSPFHGAVAFTANVTGTFAAPRVEGEFHVARGTVYGYSFDQAAARILYTGKNLQIRDFSAVFAGGNVSGEADVMTDSLQYQGRVQGRNLDMAALGDAVPGVSGRLSAEAGFQGQGKDLSTLQVQGTAALLDGAVKGVAVHSLQAAFSYRQGHLDLPAVEAQLQGQGKLGISGSLTLGKDMNLKFYGTQVDLTQIQSLFPKVAISGRADFQGTAQGNQDNPQVQIQFSATDGALFKQPYHTLHGKASGSLDGIGIESFSMENQGHETWRVQGRIGFVGARQVNLQIDTMGARMEDLAALVAPDQPITGNVDNIIKITGTLDNPSAVGYVHFYRGSYGGMLLSGMDGDYFIDQGTMTLKVFHIYSPMVDMVLNGTIDRNRKLHLQVAAHDIEFSRFGNKLPYPISGRGSFSGTIDGTFDAPVFEGVLQAPQLLFNGQKVENAKGQVRYHGHRVYMDSFGFTQNGGQYTLDGVADTASQAISGRFSVTHGDVNGLMALLNCKNDALTGRVDGTIDLSGTLKNPNARLRGFMGTGAVKGYELHDIQLDLQLANHVLEIHQLSGKQGESGIFAAEGQIDLQGPMQVRCSAKDIQAGILTRLAGVDSADMRGLLNFDAQVSGTIKDPAADVSLTVVNGGVGSSTFDLLTGLFNLRQGVIHVNQCLLEKKVADVDYKASAYGKIPLQALMSSKDQPDDEHPFDLTVSLDDADLCLLPMLSKKVEWAVGPLDGKLKITGTMAHPFVDGNLSLTDGAVKIKGLGNPLTDMQADIRCVGNRLSIENFSGKMGEGTYHLTGQTLFSGTSPVQYDFSLDAANLALDSAFYKGPLSGSLHLAEGEIYGHKLPKLSGAIEVANTTVSIPSLPDGKSDLPNIILDLDLKLGKKVHFYSSFLYDMQLAGSAHFGGTTRHPSPSGTISVLRGTVSYLKTIFKVREGEAYFNQVGSFLPSIVLRADTKLDRAQVFLALDGPANQMAIHLTSSPEMSETEILRLLTLRSNYSSDAENNSEVNALLDVGLKMSFLSEVEGIMRSALNVDEFEVERDTSSLNGKKTTDNSNREVYNVKIGKYISDKVMVRYTQGIGSDIRRYGVQYDFDNRMSLTTEQNQDQDYTVGLEARFRF